jgi:hypothetical protein
MFNTLRADNTALSFGVVNCTNTVLCPDVQDYASNGAPIDARTVQNYPFDCCWSHASDKDTRFVFQSSAVVPQSSSKLQFHFMSARDLYPFNAQVLCLRFRHQRSSLQNDLSSFRFKYSQSRSISATHFKRLPSDYS